METDRVHVTVADGSDEKGVWAYRVVFPDTGHSWEVLIARHRFGFSGRMSESYSWACRRGPMLGGSFIDQQRRESRELALDAATRYIQQQEDHERTAS